MLAIKPTSAPEVVQSSSFRFFSRDGGRNVRAQAGEHKSGNYVADRDKRERSRRVGVDEVAEKPGVQLRGDHITDTCKA